VAFVRSEMTLPAVEHVICDVPLAKRFLSPFLGQWLSVSSVVVARHSSRAEKSIGRHNEERPQVAGRMQQRQHADLPHIINRDCKEERSYQDSHRRKTA
jgi:hypothetical protein